MQILFKSLLYLGFICLSISLTFRPATTPASSIPDLSLLEILEFPINSRNINQTHSLPKGLIISAGINHDECTEKFYKHINHSYVALEGSHNTDIICQSLSEGITYRLFGGGSIKKLYGKCILKVIDTSKADQALCANWTLSDIKLCKDGCDSGSTISTKEDGLAYIFTICGRLWENNTRAHYGETPGRAFIMLTVEGRQACRFQEKGPIDTHVCVTPEISEIKAIPADNENICPDGKSLVNVYELVNSMDEVCSFVAEKTDLRDLRLAGGAILHAQIMKDVKICYILNHSLLGKPLEGGLCADINR